MICSYLCPGHRLEGLAAHLGGHSAGGQLGKPGGEGLRPLLGQQGVVNAEENPVAFCYDNGFYEVAKYSTELNAVNSTAQIFMSTNAWNQLTAEEQEIFRRVCKEVPVVEQMEANERIDEYYQLFEESGIEVIRWTDLTDEERQSFYDAELPIWDKYKEQMDPDFYNTWLTNCQAAWEKNGYTWTMS